MSAVCSSIQHIKMVASIRAIYWVHHHMFMCCLNLITLSMMCMRYVYGSIRVALQYSPVVDFSSSFFFFKLFLLLQQVVRMSVFFLLVSFSLERSTYTTFDCNFSRRSCVIANKFVFKRTDRRPQIKLSQKSITITIQRYTLALYRYMCPKLSATSWPDLYRGH